MAGDTSLSKCCKTDTPIGSPVEAVEKPTDNAPPLSAWLTLILRSIGHRWLRRFPPFFDGAQQREKVEAALGAGGAEPGEMGIADLGAEAVGGFVACAGVVHRDPGGTDEPGTQHIASLGEETVLALDQQADHLALGDEDAEAAQQRHQPRRRHLSLMVLGEHEAAQLRPEVTIDAGRQRRRHHVAFRRLPAFAAEIHNMRTDHQILNHEARVALEAGAARGGSDRDGPFLVDRKLRTCASPRAFLRAGASRWLGPPLHATRL